MTVLASRQEERTADRAAIIHWLDAAGEAGAGDLGGKAGPLVRLLAAGLPVPPGFAIAPDAFPAATGAGDLAEAAAEQIRQAYAELARRTAEAEPRVAVRSSATAEDLEGASFAGQYETFLGVRGADAVVDYARRCWASLSTDHAEAYRKAAEERLGQALPAPKMAVLVQALIPADAAGVAFTADPVTGDASAVTINAAWGLGQSVVDGAVEADTWRIERQGLAVVQLTTGRKTTRSGLEPGAARVEVPEALQARPCLTPAQATEVATLALRAEEVIGGPADVEWALQGDTLWLLQARPITTGVSTSGAPARGAAESSGPAQLAEKKEEGPVGPSAAFPFEWPQAADAERCWRLRSIDQRRSEALSPLEQDVRASFNRSFFNAASITGQDKYTRALYLNGYEYLAVGVPVPFDEADRERRRQLFERAADALHERGLTLHQAVHFPETDEGNTRLAAVAVDDVPPAELADHLETAFKWHERLWTLHWCWGKNGPGDRLLAILKEVAGIESRDEMGELLTHEPNLLIDAIDRLMALARIVQRNEGLRALVTSHEAGDVLAALAEHADLPGAAEFSQELEELLERQGLRCGAGFGTERSQCMPGWREDPTIVIALVQKYVPQDLDALDEARAQAIRRRDEKVDAIRSKIEDPEKREQFEYWLAAARRAQQTFEDHNYKMDSASNSLLHRAITASARRLVASGALERAKDAWYLTRHELGLALQTLPGGSNAGSGETEAQAEEPEAADTKPAEAEAPPANWQQLIQARKALHAWQQTLTPPARVGAPPPPPEQPASPPAQAATAAAKPEPPAEALVTGQTGSAGVATGRVRLVDHHALVPDVTEGDVLVARNAGPLWTPVFPTVAAVVLDEGVLFQHAMLTCREYGVPAVFQTKKGTQTLREGQRVTVDATNGWVLPAPE